MILRRMRLIGDFIEAFLYYDFVWLIHSDFTIWAFDVNRYLGDICGEYDGIGRQVFAQNDSFANGGNQWSGREKSLSQEKISAISHLSNIDVSAKDVQRYSFIFDSGVEGDFALDLKFYYGAGFLASDKSVTQFSAIDDAEVRNFIRGGRNNGKLRPRKVHDGKCIQIKAKYGLVNISCEDDGGFFASGAADQNADWTAAFTKFAPTSVLTEFVGPDVTNMTENGEVVYYGTDRTFASIINESDFRDRKESLQKSYKSTKIGSVHNSSYSDDINKIISSLTEGHRIERYFTSGNNLFVVDRIGITHLVNWGNNKSVIKPQITSSFPSLEKKILSATFCAGRTVVECYNSIFMLLNRNWTEIFDKDVYSMRGYPGSKRYTSLLTLVAQDVTELIFII